jgi:phage FluMu protein Com
MPTINDKFYREIRCQSCRKLLGYEYVFAGRLAFNCYRCGELNELELKHTQTKENMNIIKQEFSVQNKEVVKGGEH